MILSASIIEIDHENAEWTNWPSSSHHGKLLSHGSALQHREATQAKRLIRTIYFKKMGMSVYLSKDMIETDQRRKKKGLGVKAVKDEAHNFYST